MARELRLTRFKATDKGSPGERTMIQVQAESAAIVDLHVGRRLVGSWTLDLKPRAERKCSERTRCSVVGTAGGADFGLGFAVVVRPRFELVQ